MKEYITMTEKEIDRLGIINKVLEKRLRVAEAAEILKVSKRQVLRLCKRIKNEGANGVISKKRGAPGHHILPKELKSRALKLIVEKYDDFGPTLAHEYLTEQEGLNPSLPPV